jgi:hypothetical protein
MGVNPLSSCRSALVLVPVALCASRPRSLSIGTCARLSSMLGPRHPMLRSTPEQIDSLKQYMGAARDIYPDWYIGYLLNPWAEYYIPEITWSFDEIVENNMVFSRLIIEKYSIDKDIQVIGGNRRGRQAFIISGDHENIHLIDISNKWRGRYQETTVNDLSLKCTSIPWSEFKMEVISRPPMPRLG